MTKGKLVDGGIFETKTAAGHFAKGFRSKRFGSPGRPRGTVKVRKVGKYWGVFDYAPSPRMKYISLEQRKRLGDRWYGRR